MQKLITNPKFESLCTPLSKDEQDQLERNILADRRVRDAIIVWKDQLVDGHHRYKIAVKHGLKFDIKCMTFADEQEAKNWIIDNQLGRRNLNDHARSVLRGKRYNAEKGDPTKNIKNGPVFPKGQNDPSGNVATKVASETGVSERTIKRDGQYAEAVEKLAKPIKDAVLSGELKATKAEVLQLAEYDKASQKQVVDSVTSGEYSSIGEAVIGDEEPAEEPRWKALAATHKHACDDINRIIREVRAITEDPYGEYVAVSFTRIESSLKDAKTALWQLMPMGEKQGSVVTRMDQQRSKK